MIRRLLEWFQQQGSVGDLPRAGRSRIARRPRMPLFKPRATPRSPITEKAANGVQQQQQQQQQQQYQQQQYRNHHHHQVGDNNHDGASSNGTGNRPSNSAARSTISPIAPPEYDDVMRGSRPPKSSLVFHCQLAHGSPMGLISDFSNVRELYQKIAECYDLPAEEILFCTLNTHKVEMTELLGGQIGVGDFIFAHKKGRPKEIELVKTDDALGLTITDNGAGYAFIKRIKEGSVIDRIKVIEVGDHIERINSTSLIGRRHFEVAKMLKEIPKGSTFTLRLVEPQKNGFGSIGPRSDLRKGKKSGYGSGKETLRFKADGSAQIIAKVDDATAIGVEKINTILESFMGIYDTELATQIWELAEGKCNSIDFAEAIDNSDLEAFGFTDDFVIELWGAVTDARAGRHR
ncbi:PDZ domain-containing protein GIPC3 isoform X1 [Odontomachus brunneus]|uniref:PDZ domain-containing protein GIPC3 isoform X1 n=2 Tax=Odontomachus brunneus TaxID=486640 RepID=UPI0013F185F6|nr:PDZ domain-containing protein GIPC3 isoform X1 [Odontomachus brunneus]